MHQPDLGIEDERKAWKLGGKIAGRKELVKGGFTCAFRHKCFRLSGSFGSKIDICHTLIWFKLN